MDKLDKLYNLYLSNGLISKATPIDKFKSASDEQRAKLYELGKSSGLFATTDLNTFSSAWGGLSIDKKKEDSDLPSMEEGTSLATPKMESPRPSVSSRIKQVKNPSSFNKNIESSDYQRHTKLASVAINAADKGDKQTLINTLKEMNAIRAMYPAGVFEADKQMTEDLQSIEKVAGRKKLDVDIKTATRMPVEQPKIELKLPKGTKIETSDIKYTPDELKASVRADLIELDAMDMDKADKQVEEEFAQDGIFDKALGMINKWTVGKGWGYIPNETERAIAKATNEVKANRPDATAEEILEYAKEQRKQQILETQKDKAVENYFEGKAVFGRPEEQIKMEQALEGVKNKQEYHIARFNEKQAEIDQNIATLELYKKKVENKEDLTPEDVNNVNYAINKVNLLYDDLQKNYRNIESDEKDLKDVNEELDRFKRNYSYITNAMARVGASAIDITAGIAGFVDMQNSLLMGGLKDATGIDVSGANIFDDISEGLSGTSKSIRESISKNDELKNVNSIGEFGEWAGQLVLDQAPQIVMAMATGGASVPLMGASAAGSKFEELKDNEAYTMGQKVMASYAVGLAEALSEKIELDVIKYAFPSSRLAKAAAKTKTDEEILKQSLRTGIKGATINNIEKLGMASLNVNKEGISEVVAQLGSNITERYILDKKDVSVLDGISDAYLSGAVIGGAMIAAPALASKIVSPFVYDPNKEVSKNVSKISELTKALDVATKESDKKIIQGQIDKLNKDNFNIVDLAINRTKVLSPEEIREGVKAVERMQEIKSQVADIKGNPVYTKEQKQALLGGLVDEYNQLVLKRKQLIDKANAVQEQTTSEVPIQPEAGVGEEVAQGKPQAEPQVVTQEGVQEVKIDRPSIVSNAKAEVDTVVAATPETETGQTFNIDGTVYSNGGLVVPVVSENLTQEELTPERIADFVEANRDKIGANAVKVGIYKFPNSNQVSIDLNIVVPKNNRKAALEFARLAGQESLFDLDTFENVKTGSDGKNPMQFSSAQFVEIAKALEEGRMPEVFETVQQPAAQAIKETDENYQESRDAVMQIAQEQDEFVPGDAVLEQVTTDANGNVTGGTVSFLDADRNKTTKTISREQKEQVAEQRQPQASDKAKITENVKKAIAKLFPKLDSKTFRSAEAMREYAREKYGDEIADQIQDDDAARVLLGKDNMPVAILVNEEFSDETTFPHEAWHPILLKAFGDNQKLFGEFRDSIRKALIDNGYKDIADKLDAFANQKEYKDTGVVAEEWLAQFGGMLTSAGIDAKKLTNKQKSLLNQIKDIINKFAVRIAGQPVFLENATPETILDFMVSLSDMMARGEDISGLITEEAGATFGPADVQVDVTRAKKKAFKNNKYEVKQPVYKPEGGKATGFTFIADRMATGEWNGLDPKSGIKIKLMGGIGYPMLKGMYKKAGWAVEGGTVMSTFLRKIVNSKTGIGFPVLMSEYAHVSNLTFAKIFEAEMDWMVKSGQTTQEQQLENVNKYISEALIATKDLSPKMKPDPKTGKMMDKNANAPLRTFAIESDGKYTPKVYTSMDQLYKDLDGTFDARGLFMKTLIGAGVKNRYAKIEKYGFPDMVRVADEVSDPRLKGIPSGTSVSAIQFNKEKASEFVKDIESGAKLSEKHSAKSVGVEEHISYQYPVEGESLGWLPGVIDISTAEGMDPEVKKWFEDQRKKFEKGEISEAQLRSNVTSKARASMPEVELKTIQQANEDFGTEDGEAVFGTRAQKIDNKELSKLSNEISSKVENKDLVELKSLINDVEAPKKTIKAYKLFKVKKGFPGELFPLFVGANESVTVGEWIEAKEGEVKVDEKTGKKTVKSTLGPLAYRPGWHSGDSPMATHIGSKAKKEDKKPTFRSDNHVWAEVEVGDDFNWQKVATERAEITKEGKINVSTAHITDQVPLRGFYRYKTNPNMTGNWIISGEMKVNRVLTEKEVEEINKKANTKDLPRLAPFDYEAYGFNEDGSVKNQKQVISNQVARAYIIAKETGENPDLVKAVEGKITTRAQKKEFEATDRDFVLPFGKYEGQWFTTTPSGYRDWLTSQPWFNANKYLKPKEPKVTTKAQKAPTHVPESVYKYLTEDGNGNIVFHHYSRERRDEIRPSTGSGSLLTSREEAQALSSVGGLGMYYAQLGQKEPGVGDERHTVVVPKEKVYYMTTDPLNLYDEARARFMDYMNRNNDIQIEYAFSPNYQVAWITKVAQEKGFDMVISKWKNDADYRAQSAKTLKPIKEDIQMKATDEAIEVGDKVFVYGAPAVILDIDADGIATYKSANSSGKFDIPYSEKSMRYGRMTLLEKGPFEMNENMEIVLKTRGQKSSYDRMIEELDGVIQKSRERKVSKEKVYQNALAYLQGSKVYEKADDVEREEMVRDLRAKLGLKEKSVARIFSLKRKEPGITINEKQALRDQIRLEAKAAKDAIQARQRIAAMIKDQLSGLFKKGVIKTPQLQAITRKLLQLNFFNQDHVDNFINYMDKVFRDAEYADKLAKANTLQSRIKRAVKDKTIQAETRDTAKEFVKLAPYLATDIDAYLAVAEEVYEAVQQTKGTVTEGMASVTFKKAMDYERVQDYTKKEAAAQEDIRKQQVLDKNAYLVEAGVLDENMSLKEMMAIIQSIEANPDKQVDKEKEKTIRDYVNKYFNSYKTILEEIIRTDIDPFTGERMYLTDAQRSQVKKFLAVDLNVLSLKEAYHMVNAIDNFVMNQNLDGMEATIAAYEGIKNAKEALSKGLIARPLRAYWSKKLGRVWGEQFEQITMMHERLFGGVERALSFDRLSGLSKLLRDKIIALKQHNAVVEKYSTAFGKVKDFNKAENVFERGMLGIVARNVQGSAIEQQEEFNKQKNNIRISIDAMKQGTDKQKKEAVVAQQVYDKILKDSNSYQEARSKANENNVKAVEFWQTEFAGIFDTLQDVSRGVYNTILDRDVNYLPHTYKRFEKKGDSMEVSEDGSAFMGVNEGFDMRETGVLMKATKPRLTENGIPARILSFDFDSNMSRAMQGALIDINTASTIRQISAFYNSEEFAKLIPSKEDRDLARDRMRKFIKKTKRKQYVQEDNLDTLTRAANYISSFSASRALGSLSQIPKQTISVAANTMINTGGNIAILDVFSAKDFINKSGYAISTRGIASQADIQTINQILKKAEESKGKQALDYLKKLNDMYLELFVANPDVFIARASWLAYYKKKLSNLGVDTSDIDWSTHEINTEAADYAQRMIDRQQNFSDADLAGEIMSSQKPVVQLLRKSLFPFASFGINKKAQLMGDMSVLYNPLSSSEDKKSAVKSLASWGVEMGVYSAVSIFIGNVVYNFIANLMADYEEDDEEKEKKNIKALQYRTKNAVVEIISPIPNVADDALVDGLNFTLDAVGVDDMYRLPEGKGEKLYEKVGLTNIMQQKLASLGRMTYAGATGTYVDKFGNAKDMSKEDQERAAAMAAVYAFYAFGFVPADIGMTIDNAYYKLGRKSSSRKSGGGGKSSFGSIDTKIK